MTTFINIHAIQSIPPASLNNDDGGSPKTAVFGGVSRARVSSQAWKYAMRKHFAQNYGAQYIGCRTSQLPTEFENAVKAVRPKVDAKTLAKLTNSVVSVVDKVSASGEDEASVETSRAMVFYSPAQLEALVEKAVALIDGKSKAFGSADVKAALVGKNTVDMALFGRMMIINPDISIEAAASVAHAIGVEKFIPQRDSFVSVDDSSEKVRFLGSQDFMASVLYRTASLDANILLRNLDGDKKLASAAVGAFIDAFIRSMPSGKQGSFASRTLPSLVVVTVSDDQPLSLASAFTSAIEGEDVVAQSASKMMATLDYYNSAFGEPSLTAVMAAPDVTVDAKTHKLNDLIKVVTKKVESLYG
jgi:CRISPR system Cascade subunit CasC